MTALALSTSLKALEILNVKMICLNALVKRCRNEDAAIASP
jgi:hypothetical protein